MTTVVNLNNDEYDVYIGRGSIWGNPYSHKEGTLALYKVSSRSVAIKMYERYILENYELLDHLSDLVDKRLGCFCKKQGRNIECHGDILKRLVEIYENEHDINRIKQIYEDMYNKRRSQNSLF